MTDGPSDVLIVGYGPVGQTLAGLLGAQGWRVRVLERFQSLYTLARAGRIDHEALRIWQALGVAGEIEALAARREGRYELRGADPDTRMSIDLGLRGSISGWDDDYSVYQPDIENLLDRANRSMANISILSGREVVGLHQTDGRVFVDSISAGANSLDATAEYRTDEGTFVVACDGANSIVRRELGVGREDFGFSQPQLVVDFVIHDREVWSLLPGVVQVADPQRPRGISRQLGRKYSRMEFMVMPGDDLDELVTDDAIWRLSAEYGIGPANSEVIRARIYQFEARLADQWRVGNIFLAGDAAHVMPPFLGQGLCSGLRDVRNLSWKLDAVLNRQADPSVLDSYETERRPHVAEMIVQSVRVAATVNMTDPQAVRARDAEIRAGSLHLGEPPRGLRSGIVLRSAGGEVVAPVGELSCQGLVTRRGSTGLLDDVVGQGWKLLTGDAALADVLVQEWSSLMTRLGIRVVLLDGPPESDQSVSDVGGVMGEWLQGCGARAVVARPDMISYGFANDPDQMRQLLASLDRDVPAHRPVVVGDAARN